MLTRARMSSAHYAIIYLRELTKQIAEMSLSRLRSQLDNHVQLKSQMFFFWK